MTPRQRKRARVLDPMSPVNLRPNKKPRVNPARRPKTARRQDKEVPDKVNIMVDIGHAPTNSNESN